MIKKINPLYLLIGLIFLVVPLIIFWIYLISPKAGRDINIPTPTPIPTGTPLSPTIPAREETIRALRAFPVQSPDLYYLTIQPVEFMFTGTVALENLKYRVEPFVETEVKQGATTNSLIVSPVIAWEEGITKITLVSETLSTEGKILYPPFEYILNTAEPPGP